MNDFCSYFVIKLTKVKQAYSFEGMSGYFDVFDSLHQTDEIKDPKRGGFGYLESDSSGGLFLLFEM